MGSKQSSRSDKLYQGGNGGRVGGADKVVLDLPFALVVLTVRGVCVCNLFAHYFAHKLCRVAPRGGSVTRLIGSFFLAVVGRFGR